MPAVDPRTLPLHALEDALLRELGHLPQGWSARRKALEDAGTTPARRQTLDPLLLAARALEAAETNLPTELSGVRRGSVWEQDAISVTFDGWRRDQRVLVRALRPALRQDPVWLRRLQRSARAPLPAPLPHLLLHPGPWPFLELPLEGPSLSQLLPAEDHPDTRMIAAALEAGLAGLEALHHEGLVHGHVSPRHLIRRGDGFQLLWLDPVLARPGSPQDDLRDLGAAVSWLDPKEIDPVGDLARAMISDPPPSVDMARALLARTLSEALAERRHEITLRARDQARRDREQRLLESVARLGSALPPPEGSFCLRAGRDKVLVVAESRGGVIKGGPVAGVPARFMPRVWSAEQGLDPVASRALLRAWASRKTGDEQRRAQVQQSLGSQDQQARDLCRWLSCQARLRAVRMLLELGQRG